MGDIKRLTNKYDTPGHPWRKDRIETEKVLRRDYGLKNSRELWKVNTKLKNFKTQIKRFATMEKEQGAKEREQLIGRLKRFGLMPEDGNLQTVLDYTSEKLLDRRLQTVLVRKHLAHSMKQARQFITHRHVLVEGKLVDAPGYLVPITEEHSIAFKTNSSLFSDQHPERISREDAEKKRRAEKASKDGTAEEIEPEVVELTEEDNVE